MFILYCKTLLLLLKRDIGKVRDMFVGMGRFKGKGWSTVIRARAPVVRVPYWNCSDSSSSPKHARKLMKLCTLPRSGDNLHLIQFQKWVWQNGPIAPPLKFQRSASQAMFHIHVHNLVHTCNTPIPTKKSPATKSETQQEVCYFEFSLQVLCRFCHFQALFLNKLFLEIYINQHQIWSV